MRREWDWARDGFEGSSPTDAGRAAAAAAAAGVEVEAEDCGAGHKPERSVLMKASITDAFSSVQRFIAGAN